MPYCLEVLEFKGGSFGHRHVGYMRAVFRSKNAAAMYYDKHNPRMRALNAYGHWRSDWDPTTRLLYVVRKRHGEDQTIPPFDPADEPVDEKGEGWVRRRYPTYKGSNVCVGGAKTVLGQRSARRTTRKKPAA
jgi:hypothetical protein